MKLSKYKILAAVLILLGLVLVFFYRPIEVEKTSDILTESQLQQQSDSVLKDAESKVKIPTHHSGSEKSNK